MGILALGLGIVIIISLGALAGSKIYLNNTDRLNPGK